MGVNKIQVQIFAKLGKDQNMSTDEYISRYAEEYIGKSLEKLEDLTEEEGDKWITKAFVESL
jgi:hypothetical protein